MDSWGSGISAVLMARFFLLPLLAISQAVTGAFYFDRDIEYVEIDLSEGTSNVITKNVSLNFRSICTADTGNCQPVGSGQRFWLGASDQSAIAGEITSRPTLIVGDDWTERIKKIQVRVDNQFNNKLIYNGNKANWAKSGNVDEPNASEKTAEFTLSFKRSELQALNVGDFFSIYIYGTDNRPLSYLDVVEVRVRINESKQLKISRLQDVVLNDSNTNANPFNMDFCVYVSGDVADRDYLIRANGLHEGQDNRFKLVNGTNSVLYNMNFSYKTWPESGWSTASALNPGASERGTGSFREEDCRWYGGSNARLAIYLDLVPTAAGTYSDIVTLTVMPL